MPANQYLPIANGVGANALTPTAWAALGNLLSQGFQSGVVPSLQFNTFLRQFSIPVSALAQFIADNQSADVLDDGVVANFESKFKAALLNTAAYVDQAGQAVFFTSSGTNTYTGTLSPIPAALTPDMEVLGYFGTANTTTSPTLNLNGLGAKPIVKQGGGTPSAADISGFVPLVLNAAGTSWVINGIVTSDVLSLIQANTLTLLRQNLTVYVRPDGSDTNSGLADTGIGAFKTPTGAYLALAKLYIPSGFSITIQLSKTYAPGSIVSYPGLSAVNVGVSGNITIIGDTAAPQNYILTPVSLPDGSLGCLLSAINTVTVIGATLDGSSATSGSASIVRATSGGSLVLGAAVTLKFTASNSSMFPISGDPGSVINQNGTLTITGGGTVGAIFSTSGTYQPVATSVIAISGFTFTNFFAINNGKAYLQLLTFSGSGNTGARYNVIENGVLDPSALALTAIPGSTAGTTSSGGQVIGDTGPAWTVFTPGLTSSGGTLGSYTCVGRYQRIPGTKNILVEYTITITTVGAGSGSLSTVLPVAPLVGFAACGSELAVTGKIVSARVTNLATSTISINYYDNTSPVAAGTTFLISMLYEAAS